MISKLKATMLAVAIAATSAGAAAQNGVLAPNAPKDAPVHSDSAMQLHTQIAPYVAQARASYPPAKARYLAGLPKDQNFFVTVALTDNFGHEEMVFIFVRRIAGSDVSGVLASDILSVKGYAKGQAITVPETRILDWLISKPDGSEEGNVVGRYLDTHGQH